MGKIKIFVYIVAGLASQWTNATKLHDFLPGFKFTRGNLGNASAAVGWASSLLQINQDCKDAPVAFCPEQCNQFLTFDTLQLGKEYDANVVQPSPPVSFVRNLSHEEIPVN
ncbi:hypothetical protein Nepgr_001513 [Nepenthes gracilis]|uniref:Uncharacterized protein n=1 Tax=Nepenthes gracilis TaxID=150966 RepID=A0AAD3RX30_NEPGR|nr:hypothetical protein Nepgr_001513 [Nepenthes gracilis]